MSISAEPIVFSLSDHGETTADSKAFVPADDPVFQPDALEKVLDAEPQDQVLEPFDQLTDADEAEIDALEPLVLEIDSLEPLDLHDGELVELDADPELAQPLTHAQESAETFFATGRGND